MSDLCLVAWNCRSGSLPQRLAELAPHAPDLVFLQECRPDVSLPLSGQFINHRVNASKGIALGAPRNIYHVSALEPRPESGRAVVAAAVVGPTSFSAFGLWSQGPHYVDDVMRTLDAYDDILRAGPAVVMGDFNSGTNLGGKRSPAMAHTRMLAAFADLRLVSAYHAFHGVEHGHETHSTYRHRFNSSEPWHIDFCFVPVSWSASIRRVEVLDGDRWRKTSDHNPLKVDLCFDRLGE
ncbi:MAG: endonuclease/exonuclease/phosphatase family protein [Acidobacteriota bacterium]